MERPVERHEPGERPQPAHACGPGRGLLVPVPNRGRPLADLARCTASFERLVHQHQHRQHARRAWSSRRSSRSRRRRGHRGRAGSRPRRRCGRACPGRSRSVRRSARQRATSPSQQSQQHLQLAEQGGEHRPEQSGQQQGRPAAAPVTIISTVTPLAVIAVPEQHPRQVRRQPPLVEVARSSARSCAARSPTAVGSPRAARRWSAGQAPTAPSVGTSIGPPAVDRTSRSTRAGSATR